MKISLAAAILAGCGMVLARPRGQDNYSSPSSGKAVFGGAYFKPLGVPPTISSLDSTWKHWTQAPQPSSTVTHRSIASTTSSPTSKALTTNTSVSTTSTTSSTTTTTTTSSSSTTTTTSSTTTTTTTTTTTSTTTSAPPAIITCDLGTAIGYQPGDSVTLNTQSGTGCNRWGWYETPTLAELQAGISGPLYVGAGGNDLATAIDVGDWTAIANAVGGVTVTYSLDPGYFLDEVNIDLDCLPIDTCSPDQYTFNSGPLPNLPIYSNPVPLQYPTCSGGSQPYLIIQGSINFLTTATTCPPPAAT